MQNTSALYNQIIADPDHYWKVRLRIPGQRTGSGVPIYYYRSWEPGELFSVSTSHSVFPANVPSVGGAVAGTIDCKIIPKAGHVIPIRGSIRIEVQAVAGNSESEWIPKGSYKIDTREKSVNAAGLDVLTLHGYDAMLAFEQLYPSDDSHDYPLLDTDMVAFMASQAYILVDPRTYEIMDAGYEFTLPLGYTMREMLGYIASAYGGNFVISDEGKLLLLALGGIPEETNYLINEAGYVLVFGDTKILV